MADTWGALQIPAQVPAVGITTWATARVYALKALVVPTVPNGLVYQCTTAGTSSATTQPTWPLVIGNTVTDNGVVWTCFATHQMPTAGDDVAGDPFLQVLLSYLRTVVPSFLASAWGASGVAPNRNLIGFTFAYNPEAFGLHEGKLPALYAWREADVDSKWLAGDYVLDESRVTLLYIFEPGQLEAEKTRSTFANAIRKATIHAIEAERDPSWVVLNDPDTSATTYGSCFSTFAGFYELHVGGGKSGVFRAQTGPSPAPPETFHTYEVTLVLRERQVRDESLFPTMLGLDATYKLLATDQDPSPLTISEEQDYTPKIWVASSFVRASYRVTPVTPNGYLYEAQASGKTAATEPVWPVPPNAQNIGVTVQDGGVLWKCVAALQTN